MHDNAGTTDADTNKEKSSASKQEKKFFTFSIISFFLVLNGNNFKVCHLFLSNFHNSDNLSSKIYVPLPTDVVACTIHYQPRAQLQILTNKGAGSWVEVNINNVGNDVDVAATHSLSGLEHQQCHHGAVPYCCFVCWFFVLSTRLWLVGWLFHWMDGWMITWLVTGVVVLLVVV